MKYFHSEAVGVLATSLAIADDNLDEHKRFGHAPFPL